MLLFVMTFFILAGIWGWEHYEQATQAVSSLIVSKLLSS